MTNIVVPAMDPTSVPELYPIVIPPIYSRPFECFGEGLRYKGPQELRYARESMAILKAKLLVEKDDDEAAELGGVPTSKKKSKKIGKGVESRFDYWHAQLRLYGLSCPLGRPELLRKELREAINKGLRSPPEQLIQLEAQLNRNFLLENARERDKLYEALNDDVDKILLYPKRFFREYFVDGTKTLFEIQRQLPSEVEDAVNSLQLHFAYTNVHGQHSTLVGRDSSFVRSCAEDHENRLLGMERNGKRQKVDAPPEKGKQKVLKQDLPTSESVTVEDEQANFKKLGVVEIDRVSISEIDRMWCTLEDEKKLELYPTRLLSEHFFSAGRENFAHVYKDMRTKNYQEGVRAAAELLGLFFALSENVRAGVTEKWIIIGRQQAGVDNLKQKIEAVQYEALSETEKFEEFPQRFFTEKLLGGTQPGSEARDVMVILKMEHRPIPADAAEIEEEVLKPAKNGNEIVLTLNKDPGELFPEAVKSLGLLILPDIVSYRWILVGRDCPFVRECIQKLRDEKEKPEKHSVEKQRVEKQVEALRKELDENTNPETDVLPFTDVKGEWSIECDGVEWNDDDEDVFDLYDEDDIEKDPYEESENNVLYKDAVKKMSIFFHTLELKDKSVATNGAKVEENSFRLCANFFMGLFGGLLRSTSPPPSLLSLPAEEITFTFKGWDEMAGEPFDHCREPREGSLTFISRTQFKGVVKSMYGVMKIVGNKMSHRPAVECYDWDELPPSV